MRIGDCIMGRIAKEKPQNEGKMVGITVRIPDGVNRRFSALLALNGETASSLFRNCIDDYIEKYKSMINVRD
jgi:predicted DNA-binding protein